MPDGGPIYTETLLHQRVDPEGWLVEPFNAGSAVLFVVVAIYWLARLRGRWSQHPFMAYVAVTLLVGGVGGTLYHGLRTHPVFLALDVLPILLLALSAVYWFIHRMDPRPWVPVAYTVAGFVATFTLMRLLGRLFPEDLRGPMLAYGTLGLFVTAPLVTFVVRTGFAHAQWVGLALLAFGLGMLFRSVDQQGWLPMGTHFLWHTFGAVMTHLLILYLWRVQARVDPS